MKKMLVLLFMAVLVVGLTACGGDKKGKSEGDSGEKQAQKDDAQASDDAAEDSEEDATLPDNKDYDQVTDILKDAGMEIGELKPASKDDFKAESAAQLEVDGEDMLPLQMFDMKEDSDNLKMAKEKGKAMMSFEGEEGEIDGMLAIDHYMFFMNEGHPKQKEIYDLLKDKFSAKE